MNLILILILILEIAVIIGKLEVLCKAGYKWWIGLIPIYSSWILIVKVAQMEKTWFFLDLFIGMFFLIPLSSKFEVAVNIADFFCNFLYMF